MVARFHFSPRSNRADEIDWQGWGAEAFEAAAARSRPIFLNLTASWCHWCHVMDETTFSDPENIELINEHVTPVRVDADRHPHVRDRYIADGWPTNAFLTPDGEVLWSGTFVEPHELRQLISRITGAWEDNRGDLLDDVDRRRKAMRATRSRNRTVGLVRREAADDVLNAMQQMLDPRNGGFGDAPKFPHPDAVELLLVRSQRSENPEWARLAALTLDGMIAGELHDPVEGAFFRYATEADWTEPQYEKLLETNAGLVRAYSLGAHLQDRDDWRHAAEGAVEWVERRLALDNGLWAASQDADEEYYTLDADARKSHGAPRVDPAIFTDACAHWITALADAGGRFGHDAWLERASSAADRLLKTMRAPDGLLFHFREEDAEPELHGLLVDVAAAARACVAVAQATGHGRFLDHAVELVGAAEEAFWAEEGGFDDCSEAIESLGALRYEDRPFELNAAMARVLVDLSHATGERTYRAVAERTLALLAPSAVGYGPAGAEFALATERFFEPPVRFVVVGEGDRADMLRRHALTRPIADRQVWSMADGGSIGTQRFASVDGGAAYVCGPRRCSAPVTEPAKIGDAVAAVA